MFCRLKDCDVHLQDKHFHAFPSARPLASSTSAWRREKCCISLPGEGGGCYGCYCFYPLSNPPQVHVKCYGATFIIIFIDSYWRRVDVLACEEITIVYRRQTTTKRNLNYRLGFRGCVLYSFPMFFQLLNNLPVRASETSDVVPNEHALQHENTLENYLNLFWKLHIGLRVCACFNSGNVRCTLCFACTLLLKV